MSSESDSAQTMKGIVCTGIGEPNDVLKVLNDIPIPKIDKPNRVLIKVLYASINPIDYKMIKGLMGPLSPKKPPYICGFDFCGILLKKGSDPNLKYRIEIGDLVYGQCYNSSCGSFSEYIIVDGSRVHRAPKSITPLESSSLPLVSQTSYQAIIKMGLIKKDKLLILGGSTSTGLMAIQIAKYFIKCSEVIVTSTSEKLCKKYGADKVINYKKEKWQNILKNKFIDGIYDCIGGVESWNDARTFNVLKKDGYFVTIVGDKSTEEKATVGKLIGFGFSLINRKFWGAIGHQKYEIFLQNSTKNLRDITSLIDAHKIKPVIDNDSPFKFDEYMKMFNKSMQHKAKGKLVIQIASDEECKINNEKKDNNDEDMKDDIKDDIKEEVSEDNNIKEEVKQENNDNENENDDDQKSNELNVKENEKQLNDSGDQVEKQEQDLGDKSNNNVTDNNDEQ